jgi:lysophospholipase L1-like esterase
MLSVCKGPSGVTRFDSDVLNQTGVKWLIILHGVNDIGSTGGGTAVAMSLIDAYKTMAMKAKAKGIKVYASPILPFGKSTYAGGETTREMVNDWIRMPGNVDAVVDLESAVRDMTNPDNLASAYDSGDGLHLTPAGYQKMGDAVDLMLLK